ncbi:hypothetical protein BDY17DRAFT_319672 [Neohortaea acidophila]|uniref:Zn(2)-C6 fungal-type domain-containing protein n=1 Tax=Neohortaea acidophila TaxID=245834 RepID=A0A6A6Q480_9PEZI|nr:uncharacterized protein BDY17DRAFT_319672 [Neohortaea acidophila]KAF2487105.1 hypothetical protein BDY17DRAFT_319672 [Neohortaea acidophila]
MGDTAATTASNATEDAATSITLTDGDAPSPPKRAKRSSLTQNACSRCRIKKTKCDGKRPICGRCRRGQSECVYDIAEEGITKMQHLQHQLNKRNEDYGRLVRLFGALQSGSEEQATGLLARLRRGESLDSLVGRVEASSSSTSSSSSRLLPASSSSVQVDAAPSEVPSEAASAARRAWPPIGSDDVLWTSWSSRCETPAASLAHTPSESSLPPADTQQDVLEIDAAQRRLRLHPPRDIFPKISRDDPRLFPTAHSHDPTSASSLPESWRRPMPVDPEAPVNAPHTEALQALQRRQQDQGG